MSDDDDTIDSQKRAASVGFVVGALLDRLKGSFAKECSGDADGVLFEFFLHPLGHGLGGRFATLENDVSGEAVAEADVELGLEEVVTLDVAAKGEGGVTAGDEALEENHRFLGEGGAFFLFCAIRHDADLGISDFEDLAGVNTAHDGVAEKVGGFGFGVGSGVEEITDAKFVGYG